METGIIEVTNSMSPQGVYIGSVSEVATESSASTDVYNSSFSNYENDLFFSSTSSRSVGLSLSPTSQVPVEELSGLDLDSNSFELDNHDGDEIVADYTRKLNLTESVIKHLSQSNKNAIDVLSVYDTEKTGWLSIHTLKKCLTHHSLSLPDSDFQLVFGGFLKNNHVNYICFLKSWSDFIIEPDFCCSQKRSCHYDDLSGIGYSTPKRRLVSLSSDEEQQALQSQISMLMIRHFGNWQGIFKELTDKEELYISDFCTYLAENQIHCSLNQLVRLLAPYCRSCAHITMEEFQKFAMELTSKRTSEKLVEAFPSTFGYSTRINMYNNNINYGLEKESKLRRTLSVAQNLNNLPLYRLMLSMNEEKTSNHEEDDEGVCV